MIHIRISEPALMTMTFNALEAFCLHTLNKVKVKKSKSAKRLETDGHLFGHRNVTDEDTFYTVEFVNIDTTAAQTSDSLYTEATELKYDIASAFWPHLEYLGFFHTHPLNDLSETKGGVFASAEDREAGGYIQLILSIAHMLKAHDNGTNFRKDSFNCVDFTLGNKRMCLVGYANHEDYMSEEEMKKGEDSWSEDLTDDVRIDCPALFGLNWEHEKFRHK